MLAIKTVGLTKEFKGFTAVNGLNLNIPQGGIYGFLGANGAGKTTTIKMLTGLISPTAGNIEILEKPVDFRKGSTLKNIGYLPDVPAFYNYMKPREYLELCGNLFGMEKVKLKSRIGELLETVGLAKDNKRIGGFSRGMKQRLGIAQAIVHEPKIIFLDEPVSALDPIGRKEVMDVIGKLKGQMTIFFSTHILADIERVCTNVIIMDKGSIKLESKIDDLLFSSNSYVIESSNNELLVKVLEKCDFVKTAVLQNNLLQVGVSNVEKAEKLIPQIIFENNIGLKKFMEKELTLEDVFLNTVH